MRHLTARELAVFRRAVERRSSGQVRLPDLDVGTCEAIALWQDLVAVFGHGEGRALNARELDILRTRAWRRSAGHVGLSIATLTLAQGLALWRLAGKIEALLAGQPQSARTRAASLAILGLAATQLAACTSLWGGNIKGSFACSAPGGTCAPSTVIDDQALGHIQNARPLTPGANFPAGPSFQAPTRGATQSARLVPAGSGRIAAADRAMVHRERRVLKVVFPSYVDGSGNFHEPRVVHTVADAGGWMQLSAGEPGAIDRASAQGIAPGTASPRLGASTGDVPGEPAPAAGPQHVLPPDPKVVAEARAKGATRAAASPLDAIKAEVAARLGAKPGILPKAPTSAPGTAAPNAAAPDGDNHPSQTAETAPMAGQDAPSSNSTPPAQQPVITNPPATFPGRIED
jgi:conjugal transfer pilus assembly protein TraV